MVEPRVSCRVGGCMYWLPGGLCGAQGIRVAGGGRARTADATECATFVLRSNLGEGASALARADLLGMIREAVSPGRQLNPAVRCNVESCAYWTEGDRCTAHAIVVDGPEARTAAGTDCATFELR